MTLCTGTRLGPYEVVALLGEGGMGQVWSARDTRLDRMVAIKVAGEQFNERFAREARNIAALNHPSICTLFDVGPDYLVMELIEGPTLAERIAAGPIPLDEALGIARQIAEALEAAHEKGIVHRDLKPANIKVSADGKVKVLDFGLAKAMEPESAAASATAANSPTLVAMSGTRAGMILGTAGYMSPEQARGKAVDRRADIWSFGVVVFEMLAGKQMYAGEVVSDLLAAVILKEPDWSHLPPDIPTQLRDLLRRCLRKDPKMRLQHIGDARIAIDEYLANPNPAPIMPPAVTPVKRRPWGWVAAVAVLGITSTGLALVHFGEQPEIRTPVRFQLPPPEGWAFSESVLDLGLALSPDGKRVAFLASVSGRSQLWVRSLDSLTAQPIAGTEAVSFPFWSADSRFIAFFGAGKLRKVEAAGGPLQTICDVPATGVGGSWNRDGVIVFGTNRSGLYRVSASGSTASPLTRLAGGEEYHARPWFLPDGKQFLYLAATSRRQESAIYLAGLDGQTRERLVLSLQGAAYLPPAASGANGHLLFLRDGGVLMAMALHPKTHQQSGEPFIVAERVGWLRTFGFFAVSETGMLAFREGAGLSGVQLTWYDRAGKSLGTLGPAGDYSDVSLSPDATRVAVARRDQSSGGTMDLWLLDVTRGIPTRFTFSNGDETGQIWSRDGKQVVFSKFVAGSDLYRKDVSGSGPEQVLVKGDFSKRAYSWSPDGRLLCYGQIDPKTGRDLWVLTDSGQSKPLLATPFQEMMGQFAPVRIGGQLWVAYVSQESGRSEVYAQPVSDSGELAGAKIQISPDGGVQPRWRAMAANCITWRTQWI